MNKTIISVLVGLLLGVLAGALIMGVSQYFEGSWQSDGEDGEQWVYFSAVMGALLGAVVGAFTGLIMGLVKAKEGQS